MSQITYHEIVDAAALLSLEGPRTSLSAAQIPAEQLHDAIHLSHFLLKLWMSAAESLTPADQTPDHPELVEEILVCEPRVRLLGALLTRSDETQDQHDLTPIARQILHDHAQAKRIALTELLADSFPIGTLVQINRLRVRMERWTDLLLGVAGVGIDAAAFGFDEQRVREYRRTGDTDETQLGRLILCGLRQAVPQRQVRDRVRSRTLRSLQECCVGLIAVGIRPEEHLARTKLQRRIYTDHLITDRRADGSRILKRQ